MSPETLARYNRVRRQNEREKKAEAIIAASKAKAERQPRKPHPNVGAAKRDVATVYEVYGLRV